MKINRIKKDNIVCARRTDNKSFMHSGSSLRLSGFSVNSRFGPFAQLNGALHCGRNQHSNNFPLCFMSENLCTGISTSHFGNRRFAAMRSAYDDKIILKGDMDELPGKDVAFDFYARFEPKEILGRGVSSTVRRCIEKATGNEYAAKIIDVSADMEDSTGCTLRQATWREISVLRMMSGHPYIIELYEVFESSTYIFLVFELCKNGELFDYLTKVVAFSEKKTRQIMRQLFEAVDYVHSKNVVHRDLKPENILLDDNFNIKVSDFGFAKPLGPNEVLFELCGTPGYLAPELLRAALCEGSDGYERAVDMWACGVVMYTLLAGFPPFWHRRQYQMLRSIMEGKYTFRSPEWDSITEAPKDLIRKLLTMNPVERINATQALKHEFFSGMPRTLTSNARRRFKMLTIVVRASIRVRKLRYTPESLHLDLIRSNPYLIKSLRKAIDGCAFRVYQHWVKRGDLQNRAALFANSYNIARLNGQGLDQVNKQLKI